MTDRSSIRLVAAVCLSVAAGCDSRATGTGGGDAPDTTAPDTRIDAGPEGTVDYTSASFLFGCDEGRCTFECRLDSGDWEGCRSPRTHRGLLEGGHRFEARATDIAGNVDASPATRDWTIERTSDRRAPVATIASGPPPVVASTKAELVLECDETVCAFECALDGRAFALCASPHSMTNLDNGAHTFEVRAIDAAHNVGDPATWTWEVDTLPPDTVIDPVPGPVGSVSTVDAVFAFHCSDEVCTFECRLDTEPFAACEPPTASFNDLSDGSHTFYVRASDALGNLDPTAATRSWEIDTGLVTLTLRPRVGQPSATGALPVLFDASFNKPIDTGTFAPADIVQAGTATGVGWSIPVSADGQFFVLQADAVSTDGSLIPSLPAGAVQDLAGNDNVEAVSSGSVIYDGTPPSVVVARAVGQAERTTAMPIQFDVTFDEPIDPATFDVDDFSQGGSLTGVTWNLTNLGDDQSFLLGATDATGTAGTVSPSLPAARVLDRVGNPNTAGAAATVELVVASITVSLEQAVGQSDPTRFAPVAFDVTFSTTIDPSTFTATDIVQQGTAQVTQWTVTNTGDNQSFTVAATTIVTDGTIEPDIPVGAVANSGGDVNAEASGADRSVSYDTTGPAVSVEQGATQPDPASALPVLFDVSFSEPIDPTSFTTADVIQSGTATAVAWSIVNSGDDRVFVLRADDADNGTLVPSLSVGTIRDVLGNTSAASTSVDNSVELSSAGLRWQSGSGSPTPPNPDNFGTTSTSITHTYTLLNRGTASSSTITVSLAGNDPTRFQLLNDACTGLTLASDSTCTVQARFKAGSTGFPAGSYDATLEATASEGGTAVQYLVGTAAYCWSGPLGYRYQEPSSGSQAQSGPCSVKGDEFFQLVASGGSGVQVYYERDPGNDGTCTSGTYMYNYNTYTSQPGMRLCDSPSTVYDPGGWQGNTCKPHTVNYWGDRTGTKDACEPSVAITQRYYCGSCP